MDNHGHGHHNGHHHDHVPKTRSSAFTIGIFFNLVFVAVEVGYGLNSGSLALIADAGHNLSDVLALSLSWAVIRLSLAPPNLRFTYGLKRSSVLGALFNSCLLLGAVGGIVWETVGRLRSPSAVQGNTMIWVAALGIFINAGTALLFLKGRKEDVNVRAAFIHLAGDALISFGVLVTGILVAKFHWSWLDPVVTLLICAVILMSTWHLLKDSLHLSLDGVPTHINFKGVTDYLQGIPGVSQIHHLHIWAVGSRDVALTVHLVIPTAYLEDSFFDVIRLDLQHRFGIAHSTVQAERAISEGCLDCFDHLCSKFCAD